MDSVTDPDECVHFPVLRSLVSRYVGGSRMYTVRSMEAFLQRFLSVEKWFATSDPSELVIQTLLSSLGHEEVARIVIAHQALPTRARLVALVLETIEFEIWPLMPFFKSTLRELASCSGRTEICGISLGARRLLTRMQLPPLLERSLAVRALLEAHNTLLVTDQVLQIIVGVILAIFNLTCCCLGYY